MGGDLDLLREVAELGASDVGRLLAALDSASTAFAMVELAHELKGVLLNLTAAAAAPSAVAIEAAARSGDLHTARVELGRAREVLDDVVSTLASVAVERQRVAS